jgi:hypothetical protein
MGGFQHFCTQCGRELRPGGRFCTLCGHAAPEPAAPPVPAVPPPVSTSSAPPVTMPSAPPVSMSSAETITRSRPTGPFTNPYSDPPPMQPDLALPRGNTDLAEPRGRRPRWPLAACLVVLLVGGAAAAFLILHRHASSPPDTRAASQHVSKHPAFGSSTTAASTPPPEQQAADSLSVLLGQSVTDRSSIVSAVNDVNACGPSLNQDVQTFQNAATSRQNLLTQLGNIQDRAALPTPMIQALTSAWQASIQADQDYAQWTQDEVSKGCVPNDHSDPSYQAVSGPDGQATTDKKAFVSSWNPIAEQYGLPTYQWSQL